MLSKFNALSLTWKLVIGAAIIVGALFIFDMFTGYVRDAKNYLFDRRQAQVEAQNKVLEDENKKLREENLILITKAESKDVEIAAKDALIDKIGGQLEANKEKTEKALAEVDREIEITNQPVDKKERCIRLKDKLIALGVPAAREMKCDE